MTGPAGTRVTRPNRLFAVVTTMAALTVPALLPASYSAPVDVINEPFVATFAGVGVEGSINGPVSAAQISEPVAMLPVATEGGYKLYFTEFGGQRMQNTSRCDIGGYKCSETKNAAPGCLSAPGRNYVVPINSCQCGCDVFFMMQSGHRLRLVEDSIVRTVAGSGIRGYRNGPAMLAEFNHPYGIVRDSNGNLLIADSHNHVVRKYDPFSQMVSTLVGTGSIGRRNSRNSLEAGVNYPTGLAISSVSKTLFIADRGNNCIRSVDAEGAGTVKTIAGNCSGKWGYKDGTGEESLFSGPTALALNENQSHSTIYVTDLANNLVRVVIVSQHGNSEVMTLRDQSGGDGGLDQPTGIAFDRESGNLYVTSYIGGRVVQYSKVSGNSAKNIRVIAGDGSYSFQDGPALTASFKGAKGLAMMGSSTLFVADFFNSRIRMISMPSGSLHAVQTLAIQNRKEQHKSLNMPNNSAVMFRGKIPLRVLLWTGHSGPYHDHFHNGRVLAEALNYSGAFHVSLPCSPHETVDCEAVFEDPHLNMTYDVILLYADTYENPLRGSMTDLQWEGLFNFVRTGGGFFALHTASACWDNKVEHPDDKWSNEFHKGLLNCEFGGHSPYKDYVAKIVDPVNDVITLGMSNYAVSDELYHPIVYDINRSKIFITAFDQGLNTTAIHGLRHTYGQGRVLYFAQGHDMAEFVNPGEFPNGNHAFQHVVIRSLLWLAKRI